MIEQIKKIISGVIRKMLGRQTVKEVFSLDSVISSKMENATRLWAAIYENKAPWINKEVRGRNMAAAIASEMTRLVLSEFRPEFDGDIAAKLIENLFEASVLPYLDTNLEYGVAKGGFILKPYIEGGKLAAEFIQAGQFLPVTFNASGMISACAFKETLTSGGKIYTRLEYHELIEGGCKIINFAFVKSENSGEELGQKIELTSVEKWASLNPEVIIEGVDELLLGFFNMPLANNIDTSSPLGASVYARAVPMLEDLDRRYFEFNWEFESGKRKIFVDEMLFGKDKHTGENLVPNTGLYETVRPYGDVSRELVTDYTPEIRNEKIAAGMNSIIISIEDACGLARGTFSVMPDISTKTATELKISLQRSFHTVKRVQNALKMAFDSFIKAALVYVHLYELAPTTEINVSYNFGDNVLDNRMQEFEEKRMLVAMNIMADWEFYAWYFDVGEELAKERIPKKTEMFKGGV